MPRSTATRCAAPKPLNTTAFTPWPGKVESPAPGGKAASESAAVVGVPMGGAHAIDQERMRAAAATCCG